MTVVYIQDKFDHDGSEVFEIDNGQHWEWFVHVRIYSQFRNATRYQLWIVFSSADDPFEEDAINTDDELSLIHISEPTRPY